MSSCVACGPCSDMGVHDADQRLREAGTQQPLGVYISLIGYSCKQTVEIVTDCKSTAI